MSRKEEQAEEARAYAHIVSDVTALLPSSLGTGGADMAAATDGQDVARALPAPPSVLEHVILADVAHELALYNTHSPVVAEAVSTHRREQHTLGANGHRSVLTTTLLEACIAGGDVEIVRLLVDNGVDVDARLGESYDTSPLRLACKHGQLGIVKLLVACGARVNGDDGGCRPGFSKPVLAIACSHGHLDIVKWLVESGDARVNDETIAGVSPLADAVWRGDLQIVHYLVAMGAHTTSKLRPWRSLWYLAVKLGQLAILKRFTESKLDDLTQDHQLRLGVLQHAAEQKHISILECLLALDVFRHSELNECLAKAQDVEFVKLLVLKGANVNAYSACGDTPLYTAIQKRPVELVETLLSLGADANKPGSRGAEHSAIHTMVVRGQLNMLKLVRRICGSAADFQAPSERYRSTPLHLAAFAGHVNIVRFLLEELSSSDVDINAENYRHETPLMLSAREGHIETVQLLVSEGAAVNHRAHDNGQTALFCAAKAGWCDIAQFLCEHGADAGSQRYDRVTALCAAAKRGHTDIVEILAEARTAVDSSTATSDLSALYEAVKYGHTAVVRVLLARNGNACDCQEQWSALVCRAISRNNAEVLRLLVSHEAFEINASYTATVDDLELDITPLIAAAGCGYLRLVKYLCREGADVQHATSDNETALFAAVVCGHLGVVRYLVGEQNADFEKVSSFGLTSLEVAVEGCHHGVIEYLKNCKALSLLRSTADQETGGQPTNRDEAAATFMNSEQAEDWRHRKSALHLLFSRYYYH